MTKAYSRGKTVARMMLMLIDYFDKHIKPVGEAEIYDGFKRDLGLAIAGMRKLSDGILSGMTEDEKAYIQRASKGVILTETAANPVHDPYGYWIDKPAFRKLITTAWQSNCALCYRQGAEAESCELRKVLDLMSTQPDCEPGKCYFQTIEDDGKEIFR